MIQKTFKYNAARCIIKFGHYHNGRLLFALYEKGTGDKVCICTLAFSLNMFPKDEVIIKDYGTNEGLYQVLIDAGVIKRKHKTIKVGLNEAYLCKLLIDPKEYDKI